MKLILGSGSRFRKDIMASAGYSFDVLVSDLDEHTIRTSDPYELPLRLSEAKAKDLLPKIQEPALLITCDTIVVCAGKVYEKPETADDVRAFIQEYCASGTADVVTAVLVTNTESGQAVSATDICTVTFAPIPESAVEEFIRTGDPYSRAGGFSVENDVLAPYIHVLTGTRESIMGMPMVLTELLAKVGGV